MKMVFSSLMRDLLERSLTRLEMELDIKRFYRFLSSGVLLCTALTASLVPSAMSIGYLKGGASSKEVARRSFVGEAAARTGPAVVTIETQRTVRSRGYSTLPPGLFMDPYLNRLFGLPGVQVPRSRIETGQGSGVIFSPEGLVLTNAHVVANMDRLWVGLSDGRRVAARVVGQDSLTDLAVIRLDGMGPWPTAPLGDSDELRVGDWAIAVGNPYGLENTVTLGIVSNLNRNVSQLGISGKRLDLIQTDAAINPGNSGGPLLNYLGEVVGINTLVRSGPGAGLGFAIPINHARTIAKQLVERGRASHPMIGVSLSPVPSTTSEGLRRPGAVIRFVVPGGPAEKGGLKIDDVILSVGRRDMRGPADVVTAINGHPVGTPLAFGIKRGKRKIEIIVYPIEMERMKRR